MTLNRQYGKEMQIHSQVTTHKEHERFQKDKMQAETERQ